jgi:hypothetical protein
MIIALNCVDVARADTRYPNRGPVVGLTEAASLGLTEKFLINTLGKSARAFL